MVCLFRVVLLFQESVLLKDELPLKLFESFGTIFCEVLQAADYTGDVTYEYMAFLRIATATFYLILTELTSCNLLF